MEQAEGTFPKRNSRDLHKNLDKNRDKNQAKLKLD